MEICLILDKQGYIDLEHVTWKWLMIIYTQGATIVVNKQAIGSWTTLKTKGQQIDVFFQNLHFYSQVKIRQTIS